MISQLTPAQSQELIICADEGQTCVVPDVHTPVFYGKNGALASVGGVTQTKCDSAVFQRDPLVGIHKTCFYQFDIATLNWSQCANEGGRCNFQGQGPRMVRFGLPARWVYGTFIDGVDCNRGTFGDPDLGQVKRCEMGTE
ncbi:MAG: hypothetical protein JO267_11785 [Alphaproteobacteria bacterium]|nr:hypothetical protein [Alphaproteobacteria bacterium]